MTQSIEELIQECLDQHIVECFDDLPYVGVNGEIQDETALRSWCRLMLGYPADNGRTSVQDQSNGMCYVVMELDPKTKRCRPTVVCMDRAEAREEAAAFGTVFGSDIALGTVLAVSFRP